MTNLHFPLHSLREGHWFKLICGASFQHLPAVRNLTLAYTLAGADCIDVAADPAAIAAATEALQVAGTLASEAQRRGFGCKGLPLLMISLNDGEDPHFRKAEFNPNLCPADCPRPCQRVCPANAIAHPLPGNNSGVIDSRCYGCGRCIPVCPYEYIYTRSYVYSPEAIVTQVLPAGIDAVEIHTQVGRLGDFERLWRAIAPNIDRLKLIAVSCGDGDGLIEYLRSLYALMEPLPIPLVWQTDGRPMSGDIGAGTTHAAIKLGQKVLSAGLPGYVQLAGGTNSHTVIKLKRLGLLNPSLGHGSLVIGHGGEDKNRSECGDTAFGANEPSPIPHARSHLPHAHIAGVAYGSYARVLLSPVLDLLEKTDMNDDASTPPGSQNSLALRLEDQSDLLWQAVAMAHSLVSQLKITPVSSNVPS